MKLLKGLCIGLIILSVIMFYYSTVLAIHYYDEGGFFFWINFCMILVNVYNVGQNIVNLSWIERDFARA